MKFYQKSFKQNLEFLIFILPALILVMIAAEIPFFMSLYYSLTKWNGIGKHITFIGFANFKEIFTTDESALKALFFTLDYSILNVIVTNAVAIILAIVLTKTLKSQTLLRAAFFIPNIISLVIIGFIWKFIFTKVFDSLYNLTHWGLFQWSWLGDIHISFVSTLLVSLWQSVGFFMMIYITGLQSIPSELNEAAAIDGVVGFRRFFKITLPLLMPALTVSFFLSIANSLKVFDIIYTLTFGGPGDATTSTTMDIYKEAFVNNRFGYATAKSLLFVLLVLIITVIQVRYFKSKEVEA